MSGYKARKDKRATVDLPILLSIDDQENILSSLGRVEDLSINGMKVEVPLPFGILDEDLVDFQINLPKPFVNIKGRGKIQWKRWNEDKNSIHYGLKLEPLTLKQLMDLDTIVNEVLEETIEGNNH